MRLVLMVCALLLTAGCNPSDRRPGLWLSGEVQTSLPDDWSFTRAHPEIHLQVATPYLLPHSITIWCAEVEGQLYLGARAPETKNWPGWVDEDPNVSIGIDGRLYPVRLQPLTDPARIAAVAAAYADKYDLAGGISGGEPNVGQRYWQVLPRS